ncbi:MAG: hotdog fold thioesterase [Oligoflexia bacterium]|nr:hotdog fold thioesterase [Oligoflexia bacterium]
MEIWFREYSVEETNRRGENTMLSHLGIRITEIGPDFIEGQMPVDARTRQPLGLLHGGASVALAESLASTAGNLTIDPDTFYCVGLEINANHISSCKDGMVTGVAKPLHLGRTTQVWETTIRQGDRLVCVSRMTLAIIHKEKQARAD